MKGIGPARLRRALLAATWLAGTALATLIVYEAVGAVALQVTDQSLEPLAQQGLAQSFAAPPSSAAPSPTAAGVASPSAVPPPTQPATHTPVAGGGGGGGGGGTSSPPPVAASSNRTFTLVGGTANLTCTGDQISLNWATPNNGFQVETGSSDGGAQIEVRFRSDSHESQLQAWCSAGAVQGSVQEQSS
ncbi:MAG TPA: hypothetical protein VKE27_10725 [Candidatus Dormibacteraeota bacterium]|nr:hypothetical protein [Candidatus Dormibacteraeota bacterium]